MSEEFKEFFNKLSVRFRKETHLSDFTFTALEVIPGFKEDFVRFFFDQLRTEADDEIEITREYRLNSGDGQPDLVFRCTSWDMIVENKLWDRNYHFDQYGKTPLSPGRPLHIGLIANHMVTDPAKPSNWQVRTWGDFVKHFEKKDYASYNGVFAAYMQYVKKVCSMAEFKNFRFDPNSLFALTHFVRMTDHALQSIKSKAFSIAVNMEAKYNFGEDYAGYWFGLDSQRPALHLSLFTGLDFGLEPKPPSIVVHVHKRTNPDYFQRILDRVAVSPFYKHRHRKDDKIFELSMPTDQFHAINVEPDKEKQLESLTRFLTVCCDTLLKVSEAK